MAQSRRRTRIPKERTERLHPTVHRSAGAVGAVHTHSQYSIAPTSVDADTDGNIPIFADDAGVILEDSGVDISTVAYLQKYPGSTKTTDYTMDSDDGVILADASSGDLVITLPAASGVDEKKKYVKKIDTTRNFVVVDGDGTETIDGMKRATLAFEGESLTLYSDGSNWRIL